MLTAVFLFIFFSSCKPLYKIHSYDNLTGLDLRPYAEKGFLITPSDYGGDHTAIYLIDYVLMPEAIYTDVVRNAGKFTESTREEWVFDKIDLERAVDSIYNISIELGANGITGFAIEPNVDNYSNIANPTSVRGIRITGMAIKRLD
jgi:hypothetical protein